MFGLQFEGQKNIFGKNEIWVDQWDVEVNKFGGGNFLRGAKKVCFCLDFLSFGVLK
jgi:hypothetical protein